MVFFVYTIQLFAFVAVLSFIFHAIRIPGNGLGHPEFEARRNKMTRGSYTVTVTHLNGSIAKDAVCLLEDYTGRSVSPPPSKVRQGEEMVLVYTPSLSDDVPTHVRIEWRQGRSRRSSLVPIV